MTKTRFVIFALAGAAWAADIGSKDFKADDLFQITKVWTADFTLTPEQWKAMSPKYSSLGPGRARLMGPDGARNGLSAAAGIEFDWAHADLKIDGKEFHDIAVRDKGNGTFRQGQSSGKISVKVEFNKYVKGQKLAKLSKLNFANNITDVGWMNEELAYRLFRDAGVPAPRSSYAKVYFTVPGQFARQYIGLYSIIEDVDDIFAGDHFGSKDGALFKPVTSSLFTYIGDDWSAYNQMYDPKDKLTEAQKKRFFEFCKIVTSGTDEEFAKKLPEYIDLDEFARFMAVTVWLTDLDSILDNGQNFYMYLDPKTEKFSFIAWDQDHSFGQFGRGGAQQRENFSIYFPWSGNNRFLQRVFNVPAFHELYLDSMSEFSKTIFQPERFFAQVDEIAPALGPAVKEESDYWLGQFNATVADPTGQTFNETLKSFVKGRAPRVIDQLAGKSQGDRIYGGFGR